MKNVYYIESHPEPGLWKKEVELSNGKIVKETSWKRIQNW